MSAKPTALKSLADLKLVKRAIEAQAKQETEQAQARARTEKKQMSERDLFVRAAGAVQCLPDKGQAVHVRKPLTPPAVMQRELDEQAALQESLSDEFDVGTLLDVDEQMSFLRPGLGTDIPRKLRRGDWAIQRQLDLHGLRVEDARERLGSFIRDANKQGLRCVRIVHGKGLGSPGKAPVLKRRVYNWLLQKDEVLAFVQAKPADGGAGALVVLLAPVKLPG